AAKVEANRRHAEVVKRARERVDHFVVERAAEQRMRMTHDAERARLRHALRRLDARFDVAGRPGEHHTLMNGQCPGAHLMPSSSTSNTSVAFGGMTPPAPAEPYPISGGITRRRCPPTCMPTTP